jgi:uncharacterized protein
MTLFSTPPLAQEPLVRPRPVTLRAARYVAGAAVPSPCVGVCKMSPDSGWCTGCWRSLDEIAQWGRMADAGKLRVWQQIEARQRNAGLLD